MLLREENGYLIKYDVDNYRKLYKLGGMKYGRISFTRGPVMRIAYFHSPTTSQRTWIHSIDTIKVKGILRITRDLYLKQDNNQVHMVLFLDKNTPEKYLYILPCIDVESLTRDLLHHKGSFDFIDNNSKTYLKYGHLMKQTDQQEVLQFMDTYYICSPYDNDKDNHKFLKSLLSEQEYNLFMNKRFACTYVAVECELTDFMSTDFLYYNDTMATLENGGYYSDQIDKGIHISLMTEYAKLDEESYSHAQISNFKVIDRYSVSIYKSKWFNEDYFYSSYAKNGVLALPCSDDLYINVREKPDKDSKILLQIANILPRSLMFVYPPNKHWGYAPSYFYPNPDGQLDKKLETYGKVYEDMLLGNSGEKFSQYKIYPIFVNDILKNDWCYVTIYKSRYMPVISIAFGVDVAGIIDNPHNLLKKIVYSHDEVFLMNGYIHASQLHPISVIRVKDTV